MIAERIFHWAGATPDKTAVIHNGVAISYRRFAEAIGQARGYFSHHGATGPGYAVLAIHNLLDFWVCSLALRSLGLSTVALPAADPTPVLALPDLRCAVTSSQENWPRLPALCAAHGLILHRVSLHEAPYLGLAEGPAQWPPGGHVLHTSGTTGSQKMVRVDDALDAPFLQRLSTLLDFGPHSVLSVFDFPAWTAVGYRWTAAVWMVGGTAVIEQRPETYKALLAPGLSHVILVPNVLSVLFATMAEPLRRDPSPALIVAGGAVTREQLARAKATITPRVFNWLASTEAGGIAFTPLEDSDDQRRHRLLADRVVEIVDDTDRAVPPGTTGRIRVGIGDGPGGYLLDEQATRCFFRDGFFYPGDLGVIDDDGRLALQGRVTDVINIAGNKILPFPLETRLAERLGVAAVCVFSAPNMFGEEELHVVIEAPLPLAPEPVAAILGQELSGLPAPRVHRLAELPRGAMGKLLRQEVIARCGKSPPPV